MKANALIFLVAILLSCVDQLKFDVLSNSGGGIVIEGFVSDQPGPYKVKVTRAFPVGRIDSIRAFPFDVSRIAIKEGDGPEESLSRVSTGVYQTPVGFTGKIGSIYRLKVELLDGAIFETVSDTLVSSGSLDSAYFRFVSGVDESLRPQFAFDVFANSTLIGAEAKHYIWFLTGTFKAETDPTCIPNPPCNINLQRNVCNYVPLCSGLINVGTNRFPSFQRVAPCTCCTCWYQIFNRQPLLSSEISLQNVQSLRIGSIPINEFTFMFKTHVEVEQRAISSKTYQFWKRVIEQREGAQSLFQPAIGQVPTSFIQISGERINVSGLFYTTSIKKKSFYILRDNVPNQESILPPRRIRCISCLDLQPNATASKPAFWVD